MILFNQFFNTFYLHFILLLCFFGQGDLVLSKAYKIWAEIKIIRWKITHVWFSWFYVYLRNSLSTISFFTTSFCLSLKSFVAQIKFRAETGLTFTEFFKTRILIRSVHAISIRDLINILSNFSRFPTNLKV